MRTAERVEFAERRLTVVDGEPFSVEGRDWLVEEFWRPLDGFKLWPVDPGLLCDDCRELAGTIADTVYEADPTRTLTHRRRRKCAGLHAYMIWLLCYQLPRQSGKTAGVLGYCATALFKEWNQAIAYIAGSEDQTETLLRANFAGPIAASPELARRAKVMRTRIMGDRTGSSFEIFPTSLAGTTGGSRTKVIVDEARDVPHDIFAAFVPQVYARNGWRCPTVKKGHTHTAGDLMTVGDTMAVDPEDPHYGETCPTCGEPLEPWIGRVVAMSSAQELDGSDRDWFHELCERLEREPDPDCHVYRATDVINPKVSRQLVTRSQAVLGSVDALADSMEIEAGNVSKRRGTAFLSAGDVKALEDPDLRSVDAGLRPAVAFLDTSETNELTSLVILEDDSVEGEETFERLVQVHLKIWDPKQLPGKVIDDDEVAAYVNALIPGFAVRAFRIDDRGGRAWAVNMLRKMKRKAPFRSVLEGCTTWNQETRRTGWSKFLEKALARKLRLIPDRRQRAELRAARRHYDTNDRLDVREQSRRVRHLDVAEGIASCHYLAHELTVKAKRARLNSRHPRAAEPRTMDKIRNAGRRRRRDTRGGEF